VRNWEKFQHYKDRRPLWIKVYNDLSDRPEWAMLPDPAKAHLLGIWLLASRTGNRLPWDAAWIGRKIDATDPIDLEMLGAGEWIAVTDENTTPYHSASGLLASCYQNASLETETETEKEKEEELSGSLSDRPTPPPYEKIISHLNEKTGSRFRHTAKAARDLIRARWREGYTLDDFIAVIDRMCAAWKSDQKMVQYLRPTTLFRPSHFDEYLNGAEVDQRSILERFAQGGGDNDPA
jgi:uncharacterized phage protein (TIGR02220 family)